MSDPIVSKILRMRKSRWDFLQSRKRHGKNVTDQLRDLVEAEYQKAQNTEGKKKNGNKSA